MAGSILTAIYCILRDRVEYRELGIDYFSRRDRGKIATRLARRIEELGYKVELQPIATQTA